MAQVGDVYHCVIADYDYDEEPVEWWIERRRVVSVEEVEPGLGVYDTESTMEGDLIGPYDTQEEALEAMAGLGP